LWNVNHDDLALFFPEMAGYVGKCKFGLSCRHDEEPGCAIRQAVVTGKISPYRYKSYLTLREER
jgi:ribosome biogenesis GTPase